MTQQLNKNRRSEKGFTLMELLVVIVILGVLAGLVAPRIMSQPDKARNVKARLQMENIAMALHQFKLDNGFYPTTEQGLQALVEKPVHGRTPSNYAKDGYLDSMPADPWGNDYVYTSPGEHGDFDIVSLGADGAEGGTEENADIGNWQTK